MITCDIIRPANRNKSNTLRSSRIVRDIVPGWMFSGEVVFTLSQRQISVIRTDYYIAAAAACQSAADPACC